MNNTTLVNAGKPRSYSEKLIIAGNVLEHYKYSRQIRREYLRNPSFELPQIVSPEKKEILRAKAMHRAKNTLTRRINANDGQWIDYETGELFRSVFLTITFKQNLTNLTAANYEFKKFLQRMNYYVSREKKHNLKYSVVPEFQKRGAVHYHAIFYNLAYIEAAIIQHHWRNGFITIRAIDKIMNVGAYMTKYMTKDGADERLIGEKSHFSSRGLCQPQEVLDATVLKRILHSLPEEAHVYENTFENDFVGKVEYHQYNLGRGGGSICLN